jgi:hypothetical protein
MLFNERVGVAVTLLARIRDVLGSKLGQDSAFLY